MFNKRVYAVFKREVKERVISKGFIFMTILLPVFMFGIIGIQAYLYNEQSTKFNLYIITESEDLTQRMQNDLLNSDLVKENYTFSFYTMDKSQLNDFLTQNKQKLLDEKITGAIYIPTSALKDKKVEYYSKSPHNIKLSEKLSGYINKVLIDTYFDNKQLSQEELNFARQSVDFAGFKVSKKSGFEEEGYGNLVLSYLFTFLLYMSLLMMGQMILQSVIEEKSSKIVEVILSSVSSKELMTGKILGSAATGALQMLIWLSPVVVVASTTIFALPPEVKINVSAVQIVYLLINFFFGLLIFLGLFAAVGAIFDNSQDAQSGLWPVMLLIIIPFFIAFSLIQNPNSAIGNAASFFPLANIIVMPARMTIVEVPLWELIFTIVVNILTFFAIFPIAGKIYRVGILRTGKKPSWSEVIKWLKQN
ncbi:ABC transporter permease [Melioribacteraceae bacterium 4301-Me]|uniref:ABC transporter permease n=1 Tax=Pyranulibacter aquaticus TaxID=3163344 RepID=UPI003599A20B